MAHQGVDDGEAQLHPLPPLSGLWPQLILPPGPLPAHISICAVAYLCTGLHRIEQARPQDCVQPFDQLRPSSLIGGCDCAALMLDGQTLCRAAARMHWLSLLLPDQPSRTTVLPVATPGPHGSLPHPLLPDRAVRDAPQAVAYTAYQGFSRL